MPREVNVKKVLHNLQKLPLNVRIMTPNAVKKEGFEEKLVPLTIAQAILDAVLGDYADDKPNAATRLRRFSIAQKCQDALDTEGDEVIVSFTLLEIEMVKTLVAKAYTTLVTGLLWAEIDPEGLEKTLAGGDE